MPGHDLAHILKPQFAFDTAFDEVAELRRRRRKQADQKIYRQPKAHIFEAPDDRVIREIQDRRADQAADEPADRADHRLVGADHGRKLTREILFQAPPEKIRKRIRKGRNDENKEDQKIGIERDRRKCGQFRHVVRLHEKTEQKHGIYSRKEGKPQAFERGLLVTDHEQTHERDRHYEKADRHPMQAIRKIMLGNGAKRDRDDRKREHDTAFGFGGFVLYGAEHFKRTDQRERIDQHVEAQIVHENFKQVKGDQNRHVTCP